MTHKYFHCHFSKMHKANVFLVVVIWFLSASNSVSFHLMSPFTTYRYLNVNQHSRMSPLTSKLGVKANQNVVEIKESFVPLSTGVTMQVLSAEATSRKASSRPPLLFIHGSFHAAWCWAEHYMSYFASIGYDSKAISLRGTGGTPALEGETKVTIETHMNDFKSFLNIYSEENEKPILIAHSFGGILAMKYLEKYSNLNQFRGLALLCSVPPSGNGKMTMRFLRRSLVHSWKITAGFAMKKAITNAELCRELFFNTMDEDGDKSNGLSDEDIERFQSYFKRDSAATIDLVDLSKQLPSSSTINGRAFYISNNLFSEPRLVLGASDDFIVDMEGLIESADYLGKGNDEIKVVDSSHDVMIGSKWVNGAKALEEWLNTI